jgi:hypothetical protein
MDSDQPAPPTPPHALGAMTTTELPRYRRELERALSNRTIGSAPVAKTIRAKLEDVFSEETQRAQLRDSGRTWPVHN